MEEEERREEEMVGESSRVFVLSVDGLRREEEVGGTDVARGSDEGVDGRVGFPSPAFFHPLKIATTSLLSSSSGMASFPTLSAVFQVRAPEWILKSERR